MGVRAKAHSNIALIKYWGKKDEDLIIPYNSSLSMTLDKFYTVTWLDFTQGQDEFILDGKIQDDKERRKISKFIDIFRELSGIDRPVRVVSENHVPTAAGLASSASAYAALAGGLNRLFGLNYGKKDLSRLARRGSGSATRSIHGGIVEWQKGFDDETSYAVQIGSDLDMSMIALLVSEDKKEISSRQGMKTTVETSPFYKAFVESSKRDLIDIKDAIRDRDFRKLGEISERNALKMHATMMTSQPSIIYFKERTITAINLVKEIRQDGLAAYFTIDAGPNVKVLCRTEDEDLVRDRLMEEFSEDEIVVSRTGPGIEVVDV